MITLAVDTSSLAASCALRQDGALLGESFLNVGLTHSQTIMPLVESLLKQAGVALGQVDVLGVSAGPGSFTGLRIGMAAMKGMALAAGKPCVAVSTLEGLAENLRFFEGVIAPVMDARRSQFYTALFRAEGGVLTRLGEDSALPAEDLRRQLADLAPQPVALVGDGAIKCADLLGHLPHVRVGPENLLHQRAASVAALAERQALQGLVCPAGELAPAYLRLPQAERERLARLEK